MLEADHKSAFLKNKVLDPINFHFMNKIIKKFNYEL